jgi:hypothetical protein
MIVVIDSYGNNLYESEKAKYRRMDWLNIKWLWLCNKIHI